MIGVGSQITVLSRVVNELIVEHAVVFAHVDFGLYRWRPVDGDKWRGTVIDVEEGIRWIHGHYAHDAPEVAALRAANALDRANRAA